MRYGISYLVTRTTRTCSTRLSTRSTRLFTRSTRLSTCSTRLMFVHS